MASKSLGCWGWPRCQEAQCQAPSPHHCNWHEVQLPQDISVPAGTFSTSIMHVTLSSLVPPPAGTGPAPLALQNDLGGKAGPNPTETAGKATGMGHPALDKLSTASSHGHAECKGEPLLVVQRPGCACGNKSPAPDAAAAVLLYSHSSLHPQ